MIVLGVDPGSRITGYGFIEISEHGQRFLECGVISLDTEKSHQLRLKTVYSELVLLIEKHLPDSCAVEMPVYGKNPQSMLKLGRMQAAAMLAALNLEIPVVQYTPKEVKKSVTGNGNASKEQVQFMVRSLLAIDSQMKIGLDASDALAVGLCHAQRNRLLETGKYESWSKFVRENPDKVA